MVQTLPLGIWFSQDNIVVSVWVRSTMINGYGVPRAVWDAGHFNWFFCVSFRSYLALITLVNSGVYHTVHQWEPVLFSQHLLVLGFS